MAAFVRDLSLLPCRVGATVDDVQIAIALYDRFTALDAVGPYQVLSSLPGAQVVLVADRRGPIPDDTVLAVVAGAAFDEVPSPEVVVVPGGMVTRRMARDGHPVIDWVRAVHPSTRWTTSVCTGSILLGAAGVLEGLDATSHWAALPQLEAFGARAILERVVAHDGHRVVTAAGVSSGIDMALHLVARLRGPEVAQAIQLAVEYDPQPPFDAGSPAKAPAEVVELVRAISAEREAATLA
jgi:transcriptional regulator GlxA family with amidase domain